MLIFLSGGAKNGKSTLAQNLSISLSKNHRLYYLATMIPADNEDDTRIARHIRERAGLGFETVECGRAIGEHLWDPQGTYLFDSVTALLSNEMFSRVGFDASAPQRLAQDLLYFADSVQNAVFVSDGIYCDGQIYEEWTEAYRKGLAFLDRTLVRRCDIAAEVMNGFPVCYKGVL